MLRVRYGKQLKHIYLNLTNICQCKHHTFQISVVTHVSER